MVDLVMLLPPPSPHGFKKCSKIVNIIFPTYKKTGNADPKRYFHKG